MKGHETSYQHLEVQFILAASHCLKLTMCCFGKKIFNHPQPTPPKEKQKGRQKTLYYNSMVHYSNKFHMELNHPNMCR